MPDPIAADVAIIGGGPAGCAAAISLALSGRRVALLERTSYGPARVGETLPPAVQPLLRELGVWERFLADKHAPAPGLVVQWGGGPPHETDHVFDPYGCGWNLDRVRFDRSLYEACREREGVITFSGVSRLACERRPAGAGDSWLLSFTTEPEGSGASAARGAGRRLLSARFVIGATGRASPPFAPRGSTRVAVDNLVGLVGILPPQPAHESGAAEDPRIWIEPVRDGWWYSAPLPGGSLVATYLTDADLVRAQGGPSAAWQFALKQAPRLRSRLRAGAAATEMNRPPERIRVVSAGSYCRRRLANENYLLVGDAACAWDPLSGQGVFRALTEGREAARAVDAYVGGRHRGALADYEGRVLNDFNAYLRERHETYLGETRWPSSLFWLRRHAVPGGLTIRAHAVSTRAPFAGAGTAISKPKLPERGWRRRHFYGGQAMRSLRETRQLINEASRKGWAALKGELERNANREIVKVDFEVIYDELGHDVILQARVKVDAPDTYLLQVWVQDIHPGIWIPELRPWVSSAVEFDPSQKIDSALCGLFDSKWRPEDSGQSYDALVWGYVERGGEVVQFGPFEKEFIYP